MFAEHPFNLGEEQNASDGFYERGISQYLPMFDKHRNELIAQHDVSDRCFDLDFASHAGLLE